MQLQFSKYEGLGNDFVVVDAAHDALSAEQAVALCDRHLGIGADGVLLVDRSAGVPRMRVINADGSVPEMCGNGIRCVALHLQRSGLGREFVVDTDAGPHACRVLSGDARQAHVAVSMRAAELAPAAVPVLADAPMIDAPWRVDGQALRLTAVSLGNPHAVSFDDVGAERTRLGPAIQRDARFPQGVNVGFARMRGPASVELAVFERGAGWTRACGTGACAAAVAAVETGRAQRGTPVEVALPGGTLVIDVGEPGARLSMTGPARLVFSGSAPL